jgi:hypothetical protein
MGLQLEFGNFQFVEQKNKREGGVSTRVAAKFALRLNTTAKGGNHLQFSNMIVEKLGLSKNALTQIANGTHAVLGVVSETHEAALAFKPARKNPKTGSTDTKKNQKVKWDILVDKLIQTNTVKAVTDQELVEKTSINQNLDLVSVAVPEQFKSKGVTAMYAIVPEGQGEFADFVVEEDEIEDDAVVDNSTMEAEPVQDEVVDVPNTPTFEPTKAPESLGDDW